jgi:hypothetical protein
MKSSNVNICLVPDQHIGHLLNRDLLMSYIDFAQKLLETCGISPKVATIPVRVSLSIGYSLDQDYLNSLYLKPEGRIDIVLYVRPLYALFIHYDIFLQSFLNGKIISLKAIELKFKHRKILALVFLQLQI